MSPSRSELSRFRLILIPGKPGIGFEHLDLYDRVYLFWRDFWSEVYAKAGSPESFVKDDFTRQSAIGCLLRDQLIVGVQAHTCFDIERLANLETRYFAFYTTEFFVALQQRKVRYVQSAEFLAIDPEWRKKANKSVPALVDVLVGCGVKDFQARGSQALIGCGRRDNKVSEVTSRWGYQKIQENVMRRNFPCDLVACFTDSAKSHPDFEVNRWTEELWRHRVDTMAPVTRKKQEAA